jgi:hypothetical protein
MKANFRVGMKFILTDDAIENYGEEYRDKVYKVRGVFKSVKEHRGFDEGVGQPLYEADNLPFAVYEYEIERP